MKVLVTDFFDVWGNSKVGNIWIYENEYEEIEGTFGSDYSGGVVTKSNYRIVKKLLNNCKGIYDVYGDFGTYGIGYNPKEISKDTRKKIDEIVKAIESYPALDDKDVAQLESELIKSAFEDVYKYEGISEEQKDKAFDIVMQGIGEIAYTETGCTVYINWEEVKNLLNQ